MEFQHDKSWEAFTTILNSKVPARQAWTKFIEFHEQNFPKPYWTPLKKIEIEEEQTDIINWLTNVVTKKPISKKILAIWIGLLKLAGDNEVKFLQSILAVLTITIKMIATGLAT